MNLSEILAQFPLEHVNIGDIADHHEPAAREPAGTGTLGSASAEKDGITRRDAPHNSKSQWAWSSTPVFENICFDEPYNEDTFETSSESSDDAAKNFEIIVGPTKHAAKPYDLNQLGVFSWRTQSWEPIRSTQSTLYLTDVIRLTEGHMPTRPLSFGSVLHLNGLVECRACTFERANRVCKKKWLCDSCHMHTRVHTGVKIGTFQHS